MGFTPKTIDLATKWQLPEYKLHRADLKRRNITIAQAVRRGYEPMTGEETKADISQSVGPTIAITCLTAKGNARQHRRYRLLDAAVIAKLDGQRYTQGKGTGILPHYRKPEKPNRAFKKHRIITEGEFKADEIAEHIGVPTISVPGVTCFKDKSGKLHPALAKLAWKGWTAELAYDSDLAQKPHVKAALLEISDLINAEGAFVKIREFEDLPNGEKAGADDVIRILGAKGYLNARLHDLDSPTITKWRKDGAESNEPFDLDKHHRSLKAILEDNTLKVRWLITDLLALGSLVILAGSPKTGKTTMMMHLVLHIKAQLPALGGFQATDEARKFAIGYFNEMGEPQLKKAVRDVKPGITDQQIAEILSTVEVYGERFPVLDDEGLRQLEGQIRKYKFRLFVIDTAARVKPRMQGTDASMADAKFMERIAAVARRTQCCIVVMTQNNKARGDVESVTDRVGHTNQFVAAADDIISLYRKKDDATKRRYLQTLGRNIQESDEMIVTLDNKGLRIEGSSYEVAMTEQQRQIMDRVRLAAPGALTPHQIAGAIGKKREAVRNIVDRLVTKEVLVNVGDGRVTTPLNAAKNFGKEIAQVPKAPPKALLKAPPKARGKAL